MKKERYPPKEKAKKETSEKRLSKGDEYFMKKKILTIALIVSMLAGIFAVDTFVVPNEVSAATTGTITSQTDIYWSDYHHQEFTVKDAASNEYYGVCARPDLSIPMPNTPQAKLTLTTYSYDSTMAKIIWKALGNTSNTSNEENLILAAYSIFVYRGKGVSGSYANLSMTNRAKTLVNSVTSNPSSVNVPKNFEVCIGSPIEYPTYQDIVMWRSKDEGYAYVKKVAAKINGGYDNVDVTEYNGVHNDCYGYLSDAEYTVYSDKACTKKVTTLKANAQEATTIAVGKYYLKETKTPKGFHTDTTIHEFEVKKGETKEVPVTDIPKLDPVNVLLQKVDSEGNIKDKLAGAEYTVKYYPRSTATGSPRRTWVMKTDSRGLIKMDSNHKVSGDSFFYDKDGSVAFPYGTVTIKEKKAPEGFVINPETKTFVINEKTNGYFEDTNVPTNDYRISEEEEYGALGIKKVDQNNRPLAGTTFGIFTDKQCTDANMVAEMTSKENGWAYYGYDPETKRFLLPPGTYYVKEIKTVEGFVPSSKVYTIVVEPGKDNYYTGGPVVNKEYGAINIKKIDKATGEALAGATFTVYTDKDCKVKATATIPGTNTKLPNPITSGADGIATYGTYKKAGKEMYALLPDAVYYLKETTPPTDEYVPTKEVFSIKVVSGANTSSVKSAENEKKGAIQTYKVDQNNKKLQGVTIGFYTDKDCTKLATVVNPKTNVKLPNPVITDKDGIAKYGTYKDGNVEKFALVPGTIYYIKEVKGLNGYKMSTEVKSVKVESNTTKSTQLPFINKEYGAISIKKIDKITKEALVGAEFTVYTDKDCKVKATVKIPGTETILPNPVTTDANGIATYGTYKDKNGNTKNALEPDVTYYFKETKVPPATAPKKYVLSNKVYPVTVVSGKTTPTKDAAENEQYGAIKVQKVDKATGQPLKGAQFTVYTDVDCTKLAAATVPGTNTKLTNPIISGEDGFATYGTYKDAEGKKRYALVPGTKYYFKETKTPNDEYVPSTGKYVATVKGGTDTPVTIIVPNVKKGAIQTYKVDQNNKKLQGVTIGFYTDKDCTKLATVVNPKTKVKLPNPVITDKDGIAKYGTYKDGNVEKFALVPGTIYYIKEVKGLNGYKMSTEVKSVKVESNTTKSTQLPFINKEYGAISIKKIDKITKEALVGAEFTVYTDKDCKVKATVKIPETEIILPNPVKSGTNGIATYGTYKDKDGNTKNALEPDVTYYFKETKVPPATAPKKYVLSNKVYPVTVVSGKTTPTKDAAENEQYGAIKVQKVDKATGQPLKGAQFTVYTDVDCTKLAAATIPGTNTKLTNPIISGEDGFATYGTYKDAEGKKRYALVPGTKYYFKETKTPNDEYVPSTGKYVATVKGGTDTPVTIIVPNVKKGAIEAQKVDQDGKPLAGVTMGFYTDKDCIKLATVENPKTGVKLPNPVVTNEKGIATYGKYLDGKIEKFALIPGMTYYVKEVKGLPNYKESTEIKEVTVVSGKTTSTSIPFKNEKYGKVGIIKVDTDGDPLAGATFRLYSDKNCNNLVGTFPKTTEKGYAVYGKSLPPGETYYIKEYEAPEGYVKSDKVFTVTVKTNDIVYASEKAVNEPYGALSIKKVSQNNIPLAGAEFTIYSDEKCETVVEATAQLPNPIITDENGVATYGKYKNKDGKEVFGLVPGTTYYLKETKAPEGCIISKEKFTITIVSGETTPPPRTAVNRFPTGKIGVNKTGSTFTGVTEGTVEVNQEELPIFTPKFANGKIAGATFEIRAAEDIVTPDGVKIYSKNQLVDTVTTKSTTVYSRELDLGKYYIKEVKAPNGYIASTQVEYVTITADENLKVVNPTSTITNERIKTSVIIRKATAAPTFTTEDGYTKVTIEKKPGEGFMFGLFADEDISLNGKVVIAKDSLVLTGKTDANGELTFTEDVPFGKYYVKELAIPENSEYPWIMDETHFPADLTTENAKDNVITVNVFENLKNGELVNSTKYTKISKKDIVTGKPVAGAVIVVKDSQGNEMFRGETNKYGDTDKIYLPAGTYTFIEESAPEGYIKTDKEFTFTVGEDGKVTGTIKFTNEPVPTIKTTAMYEDGTKDSVAKEEITLIDKVEVTNLVVGKEYTVKGTLVNQDDPTEIIATGETKFTATAKDMTVEVKFVFDGSKLEGTTTVVFEDLYKDGKKVATHTEISDEDQTTRIPKIRTKVGESVMAAESKVVLKDTLTYTNLTPGNSYKVEGKLMDKETGKPIMINGKEVTSEKEFTPKTEDGTVTMDFIFDASTLGGKSVVVFEKVLDVKTGVVIGSHEDLNDTNQTADFPKVETTAIFEDGSKESLPGEMTTVVDKVKATNLTIGKEYTVKGTLVNVEDEKDIIATAETTFKATEKNMVIDVVFTFDSSKLEGESIVVFEDLIHNKKVVATHSEINDKDQTVYFPEAKTKVAESEIFAGKVALTDTITFKNLTPGEKYTAKGVLVDKAGKPITVGGKEVTSETEFIPGSIDGTVDVKFEFDAKTLEGTSIVVFEEILNARGTVVAEHKDVNDDNQTTTVVKVRTKAGESKVLPKEIELTDTISYEGLTPGNTYTAKGVLVDKTGTPIKVDGKEITSETTFVAEAKNGTVDVTFKFNAKELAGQSIVVFEEVLNAKGEIIAEHKDTNDKNQTVTVEEKEIVKTGDDTPIILFWAMNILSLMSILTLLKRRQWLDNGHIQ